MRDLTNAPGWIQRLFYRLDRLEGGANLENASITSGRMRFIGGLLRIDSGGRVEIVGTLQIDGTTDITGSTTVTGTFKLDGPWEMNGDGVITGDVTISGTINLTGNMSVTGEITVDGSGRIKVGGITLDPSIAGGALTFPNGSRLEADGSVDGARLIAGSAVVNVGAVASVRKGSSSVIVDDDSVTINAGGAGQINLQDDVQFNISTIEFVAGTGLPLNTLIVTNTGFLRRADGL